MPRRVWVVLLGDAFSALGTGLVLPFLVVYLRDVRGISVGTATLAISTLAVVGLAAGPVAGPFIDRFGSRKLLLFSLFMAATGSALTAAVRVPWHAFAAVAVLGLGISVLWPATHSLLSSLVESDKRSSVYAVHYATLNAGIGVGGIIGGLVADVNDPRSFELLYMVDALSWLVFAGVLLRLKDIGRAVPASEVEVAGSYREVLRDKPFVWLLGISVVLVTVGYSQLTSGFPAFATGEEGISTRVLGFGFAVNTVTIVLAQLFVLRFVENRRRTRAMMAICVLWAMAWSLTLTGDLVPLGLMKNLAFVAALAVFALGECLVSPSIPAILNDLASDRLRGRYNAAYSFTFSFGHVVGPAFAGLFLARGHGDWLFVVLVVVCLALIAPLRALEKRLPPGANSGRTPASAPTDSTGEVVVTV